MTEYLKKFLKDGPVYMTQEEGSALAEMGLIIPDVARTSPINPNAVLVSLTEAGQERLDKMTEPEKPLPPVAPPIFDRIAPPFTPVEVIKSAVQIDSDVPIPQLIRPKSSKIKKKRYPFDQLEIGQSFHLPLTEDQPKPWKTVAPFLTAENSRSKVPVEPHEMVKVTKKRIVVDDKGEKMKEKGKLVYEKYEVEELKTAQTKKFIARRVDDSDPAGHGARIFRVSLDHED